MKNKTVMIMAGGTGGHVFPALAVADELKEQGYDIHWLGTAAGIEADLVPKSGYPLHCINVTGLRGKGKLALLGAPWKITKAIYQAVQFMRIVRPSAVLGLGGFATGPGGVAAKLLGVPLLIHEQNAFPGMTNRLLKPMANVVMQAFPNTFKGSKNLDRLLTTGNPVRSTIVALGNAHKNDSDSNYVEKEKLNVLVVGGSLGAVGLNNAVMGALSLMVKESLADEVLLNALPNVWHQVGKKNIDAVQQGYAEKGLEGKANVVAFIDDMAVAYEWADIVVCRSGALTVSEIACAGKAAIFIPFPFAVDDHQTANAQILVKAGAAEIKQQKELTAEWLAERLKSYSENPEKIKFMSIAAKGASIANATQVVTEQVIKQIRLNE
ncbi:MAG: undecaprenyldiphospho-muramoylpentapeptide beta-N-acetylglucosaminyltransferase [Oleispira antarctica]|uniref:UDP-N-acetylglucosamine--N-acetylmuramyl-(pentapeptide) pyrophosphoryl-undecaprenol N-acetylglucosamine transferase n=1 Tax=Oleispira antarctica RB-8 TaxID=698738 RepID=R4YTN9_OLEAN|nr:undecaprenyldiphospho-muramoylpentapeptide beta-N-acetylglucosaminyltransferase [Oleispira antarctica]MBQ0792648.1 undecaprenyldiphospho-muramoylpentapeptide beta-N-acetylglucosaminyltransferase [Oleispira antarctica]CCK77183.1 UDP-N-acetylglucosamine-N-acetylmuramyl-(pentapeptide) pyrophosphoryl-undecaprenol [Oleispira antarctica RB-8]